VSIPDFAEGGGDADDCRFLIVLRVEEVLTNADPDCAEC
jgi:hypothetical protein